MIHPRLSLSAVSSYRNTLDEDLMLWDRVGVRRVGLTMAKLEAAGLDAAVRRIGDAGLDVTNVIGFGPRLHEPATWPQHVDRLLATAAAARTIDADVFGLTTGPAGPLSWEDAADRLEEALHPLLSTETTIVIEHTNSLRVDVGFLHSLRDAVDLCRRLHVGVLCEVNACWSERSLAETLRDGIDLIELVQVSDFVIGTHDTPNRVVPGDGDIPLERVLGDVLGTGYDGAFDLELIGPRIEDEGYEKAVTRSLVAMTELLDRLAA